MKPTWNRANIALLDREDREGTLSVFLDYDIGRWTFGPRLECDPCWFDLNVDLGPISLSFIYWRWPRVGKYYADYSPLTPEEIAADPDRGGKIDEH